MTPTNVGDATAATAGGEVADPWDAGALRSWATSGAMAITGRSARPLGPPAGLLPGVQRLEAELGSLFAGRAKALPFTVLQALVDRAAIAGLSRAGATSCGGRTALLQTADGWIGVALSRSEDVASLPAWLGDDSLADALGGGAVSSPSPAGSELHDTARLLETVAGLVRHRETGPLISQAMLLGMPVAGLGSITAPPDGWPGAVTTTHLGRGAGRVEEGFLVADVSALWAGPLCGSLLRAAGGRVIKVESCSRPDGARSGPPAFFDLLNGGKESLALDFSCAYDRVLLRRLLKAADVVVESSRPRALEHLGIDAGTLITEAPKVWVSITGYGRVQPGGSWVAFGDDAAVAGGLVVWDAAGPCFCGDAIADPLSGLVATAAALGSLSRGDAVLLDVAMARTAAAFSGPTLPLPAGCVPSQPLARVPPLRGPALDEHGDALRRELMV